MIQGLLKLPDLWVAETIWLWAISLFDYFALTRRFDGLGWKMFIGRPVWLVPTAPEEFEFVTWLLRPAIESGLPSSCVSLFTWARLLG